MIGNYGNSLLPTSNLRLSTSPIETRSVRRKEPGGQARAGNAATLQGIASRRDTDCMHPNPYIEANHERYLLF